MPEDQLIAELIAKAIRPALDRISSLEAIIANMREENAALAATQATLSDNQLIQLRLIGQLRDATRKEPQPTQRDRADILRALLVANGGKMLAKDARKKMHLSKERFSNLLLICDFIERKPYHLDRRQDVIILKSELVRPNC
jgi:hypothetical protein